MKKCCNPLILNVNPYIPGKPIEEVKRELGLKSVVKLASNETPYPPSKKVLRAVEKSALEMHRYPAGDCYKLRQELAQRLKVKSSQLVFGNGSDEVIVMAIRAFVNKGDEVVIAKPTFLVYEIASKLVGAKIRQVPAIDLKYDLDGMLKTITKRTKMVFIANPDNPLGSYVAKKELIGFLNKVPKNVLVFIDEAYFEYVDTKDYPNGISLLTKYPNLIVARTFSKMYGLAGLRVGYGVASDEIIDLLNRVREPFNVNSIAQNAAVAALQDEAHYKCIAKDIKKQRAYLYESFERLGIDYKPSFTNFVLIDCHKDSRPVAQELLKRGVIIRDMNAWGLKTFIRVSIGLEKENKRLIKALKEVL